MRIERGGQPYRSSPQRQKLFKVQLLCALLCRQVDIGCNSCDRIVRTACEQQPMVTRGRSYSVPRSSSPAPLCCLITALDLTGGKTHPPLSPPAKSLSFSRGRVGIRKIEGGIPSPLSFSLFHFLFYFQALAKAAHASTRWEEVQVRASGMPDRASNSVRAEIARELGSRRYAVHQTLQMLGLHLRGQDEDPASTVRFFEEFFLDQARL